MNIKTLLSDRISMAMVAAGIDSACEPMVTLSTRAEFGDFQANGVLGAAKRMKTNPRALAEQVMAELDLDGIASKLELAGPGFINIHLADEFVASQVSSQAQHARLGVDEARQVQTVVVDYSAPNLAKEMHVGHLRSTIIGDSIVKVLEFLGFDVVRQNHMGDWGTQFGMLIAELEEQLGKDESPVIALHDLEVFYQQAKKHFDEDEAFAQTARDYVVKLQGGDLHCRKLWQQFIDISVAHSEELYRQLNVSLTAGDVRAESSYNDDLAGVVAELERQNITVDSEGAKLVFLQELADKNGNPSPVIVQKSGGGFLYSTSDLAAVKYRANQLNADRVMYFIDARQSLHMKQIFLIAKKAGFAPEAMQLEHHPFGTMMGKDGKPFKTRAGGTVKLADLLVEAISRATDLVRDKNPGLPADDIAEIGRKVGIGAVKYADLSKTRTNDYIFDWDSMLSFEGNTAPYLQYADTRIRSIFRKANIDKDSYAADIIITQNQEKQLALKLLQFEQVLQQVASDAYPHTLCNYVYDVASLFMSFYEHCPILKEDVSEQSKSSRLMLAKLSSDILSTGLDLLGIETMEQM
jgi:arginyl-tRNA synthetase